MLFSSKENENRDFTYAEEVKSFFSSVEASTISSISGEEGLQVVNIIEDIKESSRNNCTVFCQ